jgi:hypothetical protein
MAFPFRFAGVFAGVARLFLGVMELAAGFGAVVILLGVLPAVDLAFGIAGSARGLAVGVAVRLTAIILPLAFAVGSPSSGSSSGELNPLTGTFVVRVLATTPLERALFGFCEGNSKSNDSETSPPSFFAPSNPIVKFGSALLFFPLPLGVSSPLSSRSASTITLMRHGESTEFDVAVILVGEWILTADVLRPLDGDEGRFEGERERREGSEMEGPIAAERGSGEEWYGIVGV